MWNCWLELHQQRRTAASKIIFESESELLLFSGVNWGVCDYSVISSYWMYFFCRRTEEEFFSYSVVLLRRWFKCHVHPKCNIHLPDHLCQCRKRMGLLEPVATKIFRPIYYSLRLMLWCVLLLVFVADFHSGWPRHHLAPTSCHQVLFSLFEFSQQSLYAEMPRAVYRGFFRHFYPLPTPSSLLWLFMCICMSTTEACIIASTRSMEPRSPADLFKTVQSCSSPYLFCIFTLCLTFRSASLSSCAVSTVQATCSGLLWILNMLLQTKDWYDKKLNALVHIGSTKPPRCRQGKEKVDYTEDDVACKRNGGRMDRMRCFNKSLNIKKIFKNLQALIVMDYIWLGLHI